MQIRTKSYPMDFSYDHRTNVSVFPTSVLHVASPGMNWAFSKSHNLEHIRKHINKDIFEDHEMSYLLNIVEKCQTQDKNINIFGKFSDKLTDQPSGWKISF